VSFCAPFEQAAELGEALAWPEQMEEAEPGPVRH
jgi:hypothetical protein